MLAVLITVDEVQDVDRDEMVQLVGYQIWRKCRRHVDGSPAITMNDVGKGAMEADREFCGMVGC